MTAEEDDIDETAAENSSAPGESEDTKNKKRRERLEQNRVSARESRKRKKTMIEELQRTVITLSRENKDLNDRNEQLRSQLMDIGAKYPNMVPVQAIIQGVNAAAMTVPTPADVSAAAAPTAPAAVAHQPAAVSGGTPGMVAFPMFWPQMTGQMAPVLPMPTQQQQLPEANAPAAPPASTTVAQPQQLALEAAPEYANS